MAEVKDIRAISYVQAVNEALKQEMERDSSIFIMGEDISHNNRKQA